MIKAFNDFYHPSGHDPQVMNSRYELEFHVQVGSKLYPEYPIRSLAEAFYQLRTCLGIHSSSLHSIDINPHDYRNSKFIVVIDMEKYYLQALLV